jgi:hypothetical protein
VNRRRVTTSAGSSHGGLLEPLLVPSANTNAEADDVLATLDLGGATTQNDLPTATERRAIVARDALAGVDGFRVIVHLFFSRILGIRFCPKCPNCECADLSGSNARPVGGCFGRVDAVYGSIEAQKSAGSLHLHAQVFVQCLHQHTPLKEIFRIRESELQTIVNDYKAYKAAVSSQAYADPKAWEGRKDAVEKAWPLYDDATELTRVPDYLCPLSADADGSGTEWWRHFQEAVQIRQEMRQNHVHRWNEKLRKMMPLRHCQRADDPTQCKSFFPRTTWLVPEPIVLCRGFLEARDMPRSGPRNMIGTLHGPMNDPNLNGTLPALLCGAPGLNFNSDVQLPYRFPIKECTHAAAVCDGLCCEETSELEVIKTAQKAQNAAAGYAADYQCKNCASAYNEVKELKKGHHALAEKMRGRTPSYIGHRHATRLLSDFYGKGVVRSAQEAANLRAYADARGVTAAESI